MTSTMRALDDLGNRVALDRETGQMDRVLGVDYGLCECGCGEEERTGSPVNLSSGFL